MIFIRKGSSLAEAVAILLALMVLVGIVYKTVESLTAKTPTQTTIKHADQKQGENNGCN